MLIEFKQGIYRQQDSRTFLTLTEKGVNLNVDDSPTIITMGHGREDYLFTEDESIIHAWKGPFSRDKTTWLYWDIDLTTGRRTFGHTTTDPFLNKGYGNTLPPTPVYDQHFFLVQDNVMKHYNGHTWRTVVRVFAGSINRNAALTIFKVGTQAGRNIQTTAGHILFNADNIPIKRSGIFGTSEFATTETEFSSQDERYNTYKISSTQLDAKAFEPIPKFYCVNFKGPKRYGIASRLDPSRPCIGVSVEDLVKDRVGKIVTHGFVNNPGTWNFKHPHGTPLWVGIDGQVSPIVPQHTSMQNIGYVVDSNTIFVNTQHPVTLLTHNVECVMASPTPTPFPTMTMTPPPTATMTPTVTVTPTVTASVTPTTTVTPTVTPTVTSTTTVTPTVTPTTTVTPPVTVTPTSSPPPPPTLDPAIFVMTGYTAPLDSNSVPLDDARAYIELYPVNETTCNTGYGEAKTNVFDQYWTEGSWENTHLIYKRTAPVNYTAGQFVFKMEEVSGYANYAPPLYSVNSSNVETGFNSDVWKDLYAPVGSSSDNAGMWKIYHRPTNTSNVQGDAGVWDIIIAVDNGSGQPVSVEKADVIMIRWKGSYSVFSSTPAWFYDDVPPTPLRTTPESQVIWEGDPIVNYYRDQSSSNATMYFYSNSSGQSDRFLRDYRYDQMVCEYSSGEYISTVEPRGIRYQAYGSAQAIQFNLLDALTLKVDHVSGTLLTTMQEGTGTVESFAYGDWAPSYGVYLSLENNGVEFSVVESVFDITIARNATPDNTGATPTPVPGSEQTRRIKFIAEIDNTNSSTRPPPSLEPPVDPAFPARDPMQLVVRTTGASEVFTIQLDNQYGASDYCAYDFAIDWGDGVTDYVHKYDQAELAHTYAIANDYTVTITGTLPHIYFNGSVSAPKVREISQWGDTRLKSLANSFKGCTNMVITAVDAPVLTNVETVQYCFQDTTFVTGGLANWDVSEVINFSGFITGNINFNEDIGSWNTCSARVLYNMFGGCTAFNQNLDSWEVGDVYSFRFMFSSTGTFNQPLNSWDMSSAEDIGYMFSASVLFNQPLNNWNLVRLDDMDGIFSDAFAFNSNISTWQFPRIDRAHFVFGLGSVFDGDISAWDLSNASTWTSMFYNNTVFTGTGLSAWGDKLSGQFLDGMFSGATAFTGDITGWNVSSINDFGSMFENNTTFNQDLSGWVVTAGTDFEDMFRGCTTFNQDVSGWNISNGLKFDDMFNGATAFSTINYDLLLNAWALLTLSAGEIITFSSQYTIATSQAARDIIAGTWTITDLGGI